MNQKLVIGVVAVVVAAAGGFLAQRALTDRGTLSVDSESASKATGAASSNVPTEEEAPPKPRMPEVLPAISLADRNGTTRTLTDWKGQPLIVNFWATWCGPCRDEIPLLESLRKDRAADRLEIVGIAIDEREAVLQYAKDIGMNYPILIGEQDGYEAAEAFGVALVLPFSVFADSQGRIVTLKVGELHADEAGFILDRVRDVDASRLPLEDARRQIADKLRDFAAERARQDAAG